MRRIAFVGGGPRTTGLLERLAANAPELWPCAAGGTETEPCVEVHVIDPFPPGGGRVWRRDQSPLLWMNSMAEDVTIFADASVTCSGPIRPGPTLAEWVLGVGRPRVLAAGLDDELSGFTPRSFPSRALQSLYLGWAFERAVAALPGCFSVIVHRDRAVGLGDGDQGEAPGAASQLVRLESGETVEADVVVLAQGHLEMLHDAAARALGEAADRHDLVYVPPGYTADIDLSVVPAGESAIVRGFGLAFIDAMVLLTEGRGGGFERDVDGVLAYRPSGREPVLWVGSGRGVPYRVKLGYAIEGMRRGEARYLDDETLDRASGGGRLDFRRDIGPRIEHTLAFAHYEELFARHPGRVAMHWEEFRRELEAEFCSALAGASGRSRASCTGFRALLEAAVPDKADRFDLAALDRPLAGLSVPGREAFEEMVATHIRDDLHRRSDPRFSPDLAVFNTLLAVYYRVRQLVSEGRLSPRDRIEEVDRRLHGLFSYIASGPPPERMEQLLALHRARIVRFAGPDLEVKVRDGRFVARSPAVPDPIIADTLLDARLARNSAALAADRLIQDLLVAGDLLVEEGSKIIVDADSHPLRADGTAHPVRFVLGPAVSAGAGEAAFSRPRINAPVFRANDRVARNILTTLRGPGAKASLEQGRRGALAAGPG